MNKQNVRRLYEKPSITCVNVIPHGLLEGDSFGKDETSIEGGGSAKSIKLDTDTDGDFNNRWSSN